MIKLKNKRALISGGTILAVAVSITVATLLTRRNEPAIVSQIAAAAYVLIDLDAGKTLYESEPNKSIKIGSLTKLMSVYICFQEIEHGNISLDDTVIISSAAVSKPGPTNNLKEGMEITLDSLLHCVLLSSGNDAITAISVFACGDELTMVERMNRTAIELGMSSTGYIDCSGVNTFDNRSTVHDLTLLVLEILEKYPQITNYTKLREATVESVYNGDVVELVLHNTNVLLGTMDGVYGLKTGTAEASYNAIVLLKDGAHDLMAIVLGAPNNFIRWDSAKKLLTLGISR